MIAPYVLDEHDVGGEWMLLVRGQVRVDPEHLQPVQHLVPVIFTQKKLS